MNILITGATGFIGRHLTEKLSKQTNHNLFCLVRNPAKAERLKKFGVHLIYADIIKKNSLKKLSNGEFDIVFHCAALVKSSNCQKLYQHNAIGTENICDLALKVKVSKMIYISSVAVVSGNPQIPLTEDLPFKATNPYGESKIEAEKIVIKYRKKGLKVAIIRPSMVYGEDEPHVFKKIVFYLKKRLLPLVDRGTHKLHLVYIENVVDLLIYAMAKEQFLEGSYFISDNEILSTKEVFEIMAKAINAKPPMAIPEFVKPLLIKLPFIGKQIKFLSKDRVYSIGKIKNLGFKPRHRAQDSLAKSAKEIILN